jgi:hypothetical protein
MQINVCCKISSSIQISCISELYSNFLIYIYIVVFMAYSNFKNYVFFYTRIHINIIVMLNIILRYNIKFEQKNFMNKL